MSKASTLVLKTQTDKVEFKSEGRLSINDENQLIVETEDFGSIELLNVVNELELLGENIEVKFTLKTEVKEEIHPSEIA